MAEAANPLDCVWRGAFTNTELNALHTAAFAERVEQHDWRAQLERWSLGWVTARERVDAAAGARQVDGTLIGFVNVAWDGHRHAFVLDTAVANEARRRGVASRLIEVVRCEADRAGCEWLHVDFVEELGVFYLDACGFKPTAAGLVRLQPSA